jgi:hypothetical protein
MIDCKVDGSEKKVSIRSKVIAKLLLLDNAVVEFELALSRGVSTGQTKGTHANLAEKPVEWWNRI